MYIRGCKYEVNLVVLRRYLLLYHHGIDHVRCPRAAVQPTTDEQPRDEECFDSILQMKIHWFDIEKQFCRRSLWLSCAGQISGDRRRFARFFCLKPSIRLIHRVYPFVSANHYGTIDTTTSNSQQQAPWLHSPSPLGDTSRSWHIQLSQHKRDQSLH